MIILMLAEKNELMTALEGARAVGSVGGQVYEAIKFVIDTLSKETHLTDMATCLDLLVELKNIDVPKNRPEVMDDNLTVLRNFRANLSREVRDAYAILLSRATLRGLSISQDFVLNEDMLYGLAESRTWSFSEDYGPNAGKDIFAIMAAAFSMLQNGDTVYMIDQLNNEFLGTAKRRRRKFQKPTPGTLRGDSQRYAGALPDEEPRVKEFREFLEAHDKYSPLLVPGRSDEDIDKRIRRACKAGIEFTVIRGHHVHFILDGLDMERVVKAEHASTITTAELRHVFKLRDIEAYKKQVVFWKDGIKVPAPWNSDPKAWVRFDEYRQAKKTNVMAADTVGVSQNKWSGCFRWTRKSSGMIEDILNVDVIEDDSAA